MARRAAIAALIASAASLVAAATEPCAVVRNLYLRGSPIPATVCAPPLENPLKTPADSRPRRPGMHV